MLPVPVVPVEPVEEAAPLELAVDVAPWPWVELVVVPEVEVDAPELELVEVAPDVTPLEAPVDPEDEVDPEVAATVELALPELAVALVVVGKAAFPDELQAAEARVTVRTRERVRMAPSVSCAPPRTPCGGLQREVLEMDLRAVRELVGKT